MSKKQDKVRARGPVELREEELDASGGGEIEFVFKKIEIRNDVKPVPPIIKLG